MKIYPVFFNKQKVSNKGNNIGFNNFKANKIDYQNQNDAFVRLAIASTRDKQIEHDLKSMGLI